MENHIPAIAAYREIQGLTQAKLAEKLNVTCGAVANWEVGYRKPNIMMLKKIALILHCTTDDLLEPIVIAKVDEN